MDGILNIYKEPGYTSRDVVNILQKKLNQKKIGHAGTLDPDAGGVLVVCLGKATRISEYLMDSKKIYIAEMMTGLKTDTGDISGSVIQKTSRKITEGQLMEELSLYQNRTISQVPPMYSAIKVQGKRLYQYAHAGEFVDRKQRKVIIYHVALLHAYQNRFILRIECSKGTYIRTFIEDLAESLNCFATMSSLLRIKSGGQKLEDALKIDAVTKRSASQRIISIENALQLPMINIDEKYFKQVSNGVKLEISDKDEGLYAVYCKKFIGIGEIQSNILHMRKVFLEK